MERPRTISANASFSSYLKQTTDHVDDTEISIFDARKYYFTDTNLKPNDPSVLSRISSASSADGYGRHLRRLSFNAAASTPTASSEASWNSQTGLLSNPPGAARLKINPPTTPSNSGGKGSLRKWLFHRKCPCTGDKSVEVESTTKPQSESFSNTRNSVSSDGSILKTVSLEQRTSSTNPRPPSWGVISGNTRRISAENHQFPAQTLAVAPPITAASVPLKEPTASAFTFPILDNPPQKPIFRLPPLKSSSTTANPNSTGAEEPPRDSLEVFRPKEEYVVGAPQRRNSRQSFTFPGSPNSRTVIAEDDVGSDASSDLFEIESFSTQATTTTNCSNYPPYPRRDSMDEAAVFQKYSPMTEGYEPSEASVEWSVTTAEGFAPAASEMAEEAKGRRRAATGNGSLLSCRCERAVSVGPRPHPVVKELGQLAPQTPPPPTSSSVRHVTFAHHKTNHHSANAFSVSGAH